ncbi:MAG: YggT family protein [Firmicutes bacterium]|nr:YggT family protein [Bacillota bacterium]
MTLIIIVDRLFEIYWWMLVIRFFLSWIPNVNYGHPIVQFLFKVTDPIVRPFQGILPIYGGLDFSPLLVFLVLRFVRPLVRSLLIRLLL